MARGEVIMHNKGEQVTAAYGSCPRNGGEMSRKTRWRRVEQTETGGRSVWEADSSQFQTAILELLHQ